MKPSRYNKIIPLDAKHMLIFNGLRGSFCKCDANAMTLYSQIEQGVSPQISYPGKKKDMQQMKKSGILVDDEFNEISYLKAKNRLAMFGTGTLGIALIPTLNCNFRCPYCHIYKQKEHWHRKRYCLSPHRSQKLSLSGCAGFCVRSLDKHQRRLMSQAN